MVVLWGFLGSPETPSEIARAPMIRLGDKKNTRVIHTVLSRVNNY